MSHAAEELKAGGTSGFRRRG